MGGGRELWETYALGSTKTGEEGLEITEAILGDEAARTIHLGNIIMLQARLLYWGEV